MSNEYREYCYAHINEEGWAWMTECMGEQREIMTDRIILLDTTGKRDQEWYQSRYYNFETSEWGEKYNSPEPDPIVDPKDVQIADLRQQNIDTMLALTEMFEEKLRLEAKK